MSERPDGSIPTPNAVRLDVCVRCQLNCPACPGIKDPQGTALGWGHVDIERFRSFIDRNPQIRWVELASSGEVFLNRDLPQILEYASQRGVITTINEGANLNHASDEALEALVRYGTAVVRCPVDGITQQSYSTYRIGGNLKNVLSNIRKINKFKEMHNSPTPILIFQFILFEHNQHEVERAIALARILKMRFDLRFDWRFEGPLFNDPESIRKRIGSASRQEHLEKNGKDFYRGVCFSLWKNPQINWDGNLLGCSNNRTVVYSENALEGDLDQHYNGEKIRYVRRMLMGLEAPREDLPCFHCETFHALQSTGNWITEEEIENWRPPHERAQATEPSKDSDTVRLSSPSQPKPAH